MEAVSGAGENVVKEEEGKKTTNRYWSGSLSARAGKGESVSVHLATSLQREKRLTAHLIRLKLRGILEVFVGNHQFRGLESLRKDWVH
jgi:predicted DNA-binding protein with PD1-like motif